MNHVYILVIYSLYLHHYAFHQFLVSSSQLSKPSWDFNVSGKGVFATKDFRAGEFLLEYHGELISNEEACRREQCYPSRLGSFLFFFKLRKKELW